MAYTGSGFGPTGSVFGGFAGGYTQSINLLFFI
jgi:hypothetical protein